MSKIRSDLAPLVVIRRTRAKGRAEEWSFTYSGGLGSLNLKEYDDWLKIYKELQDLPEPIVLLTYKNKEALWVTLRQQDMYWQKADAERNSKPFVKALQEL